MENKAIENSNAVSTKKQTGKIMFKFDDDEPFEFAQLFDSAKFSLTLEHPKENVISPFASPNGITFTDKSGKKFNLYVEKIN